jgi:transcriptional regulator with XRE-family HTH domain
MPTNLSLRALRNSLNVTVREVELESRKIAEAKGDMRFYISNARLTQLESNSLTEPSLWKLFSLSAIYKVRMTELMRLYNVEAEESDRYRAIATPNVTSLLKEMPDSYRTSETLRDLVQHPENTTLLPRVIDAADHKPHYAKFNSDRKFRCYGYIGLQDFTMYPLIRPGSLVEIDTRQKKWTLIAWRNEYERPIYFVEIRNGYACGWCDLQGKQLLLIPHQSSPVSIRRFTYPNEIEIVGRVEKFTTPCIDERAIDKQ